jgi:serine/threonine protein kinase
LIVGQLKRLPAARCHTFLEIARPLLPDWPSDEIENFAKFLEAIMIYNPKERPKAAELLKHVWLNS